MPAPVGRPLSAPVVGSRAMPGGSEPAASDHVYGARPPLAAAMVARYSLPTTPVGVAFGEAATVSGVTTAIVNCLETERSGVNPSVSPTLTVKV